jgi:hypothetical protein
MNSEKIIGSAICTPPASLGAFENGNRRTQTRAAEIASDREVNLPVWVRQSEIEEKLDLTKNQAPSQIEAVENGKSNGINEKLGAAHRHTPKSERGVKV